MGDRAYMRVTCRQSDADRFVAVGFTHDHNESDGTAVMIDDERNYADTDELPRDIPYAGYHGAGWEYGEGLFACDGHDFAYCDSLHGSYAPSVVVQADGTVAPDDLQRAQTYLAVLKRAHAAFGSPALSAP